ncbi:uncharacterized protein LOC124443791 isoform X1 [Xenia sp. Carnegie-2017]|uniref:uncharacterized protein LOC124443791 isoform X1 n=1 Tax=Xenia sp. Carnegie-2017 TaxID=2897299 RepID=UPI001F037A4C|nr:uncharacterized protein LOC124443791 isoform X1 [Xenia sp. Carnegie-2017]
MRVDSPGHSGLFGSGSSLDVDNNVILDTQIIKSTEVKNSNAMELESIKRQLAYLENGDVKITKLVTDRHIQVTSYMAKEKPEIEHVYDVWHVAKGAANSLFASINHSNISASVVDQITGIVNHVIKYDVFKLNLLGEKKRLLKLAKKKKFCAIKPWIGSIINHLYWVASSSSTEIEKEEKWKSLANHIADIHTHEDNKVFTKCLHEATKRQWLKKGSAAHKKLTELISRPRLISAVRKLSSHQQTSGLEAKHSLDNLFASKNTYYPYHSIMARLFCANLHYNENANRPQATTQKGDKRWSVAYPKAHKGEKAVAKPISDCPTYNYVQDVLTECLRLRKDFNTTKIALENAKHCFRKNLPHLWKHTCVGSKGSQKMKSFFADTVDLQRLLCPTIK